MLYRMYVNKKTVLQKIIDRTLAEDKMGLGAYVWIAHRISGLILLLFFVVHLFTLSNIIDGEILFDQKMKLMDAPWIKAGEIILIAVLLFHCFNGLRLIAMNIFPRSNENVLAYISIIASIVFTLVAIPVIF
jgi:succinate dehydrogenase / fumarate reductase cytochrome b subunit